MLCTNCYTGCTDMSTDKCTKYTGIAYPVFSLNTGDSQSYVNQILLGHISTILDGTGISFTVGAENTCELVTSLLPECSSISIKDYITAYSKIICEYSDNFTNINNTLTSINATFVACSQASFPVNEGIHSVVQSLINENCSRILQITQLSTNITENYVAVADIDGYIENYLNEHSGGGTVSGMAAKMIPFTVVEYYGSLSHFDSTGAGIGEWVNIYLCNGNNNTPDKRGRVGVGATEGLVGGVMHNDVNPSIAGNPAYVLGEGQGTNTVTLTPSEVPSHSHTGTTSTDPGHIHNLAPNNIMAREPSGSRFEGGGSNQYTIGRAEQTAQGGSHSHTFTTNSFGGGAAHANIQPVLPCYYIMYIPV